MLATLAAAVVVLASSLALGAAALALCGVRRHSPLAPALGLAILVAAAWSLIRLPSGATGAAVGLAILIVAAAVVAWRLVDDWEGVASAALVGVLALLAAFLPFVVAGGVGILGTGFNPDMAQHLLAADRLLDGGGGELRGQGYPLGPHALVAALHDGLGVGLVQGFSALTVAIAAITAAAPLSVLRGPRSGRVAAALVVGLAYLLASYLAQGSFKETMQALFLLAFVLSLRAAGRDWSGATARFVPAALIAAGTVYAYSFPGLLWLGLAALLWLALARGAPPRELGVALVVFLLAAAPEVGRMIDFQRFETFDPDGPGLGNLFGQVSPLTALGIWPSGDFRLAAGDGAVPALVFYLGAAFAAALLLAGLVSAWRRREAALLAGVGAVAVAYLASRLGGTAYTSAKALCVAAPLLALAILAAPGRLGSPLSRGGGLGAAYLLAAGGCALLALANAPVGPREYSPSLTALRAEIGAGSTLALAPARLLEEEEGERYVVWELRGNRVCVAAAGSDSGSPPPGGIRFVVTWDARRPFPGFVRRRRSGPYTLWERARPPRGPGPCPLIAVRQARQGPR